MKKGFKTSEFTLVVIVAVFAVLVVTGWLTPAKVQDATAKMQQTTEAVPALIAAGKDLIGSLAPLAGLVGLAWAYLKRRSQIKVEEVRAAAEARKIEAQEKVALARLGQPENAR